jgi:hypothetical protein
MERARRRRQWDEKETRRWGRYDRKENEEKTGAHVAG